MDEVKKTDREDDLSKRWRRPSRTSAFWIFFVLVLIFAAKFFNSTPSDAPTISYIDYRDYLENEQIAEESAQGSGQHLEALASLTGCSAEQYRTFETFIRRNHGYVFADKD